MTTDGAPATLLERCLPEYDVAERHAVAVAAPPERVFAAVRTVTAADLPVFRLLLALRALPAAGDGGRWPVVDRRIPPAAWGADLPPS